MSVDTGSRNCVNALSIKRWAIQRSSDAHSYTRFAVLSFLRRDMSFMGTRVRLVEQENGERAAAKVRRNYDSVR